MSKSDDAISRQDAINALDDQIALCGKALKSFDISMIDEHAIKVERASLAAFRETLECLPSTQPQLNTGHWIPDTSEWGSVFTTVDGYTCSECGEFNIHKYNFCPICGANMWGDEDE